MGGMILLVVPSGVDRRDSFGYFLDWGWGFVTYVRFHGGEYPAN